MRSAIMAGAMFYTITTSKVSTEAFVVGILMTVLFAGWDVYDSLTKTIAVHNTVTTPLIPIATGPMVQQQLQGLQGGCENPNCERCTAMRAAIAEQQGEGPKPAPLPDTPGLYL